MPRLKNVIVDFSGSYDEVFVQAHKEFIRGALINSIRSVHKLTINPTNHNAKIQSSLALFFFIFSNLKDFVLVRFCGV